MADYTMAIYYNNSCTLCNVPVELTNTVLKVHEEGKQHIKNMKLFEEVQRTIIIINHIDPEFQKAFILYIANSFGEISKYSFTRRQISIVFNLPESATLALAKTYYFNSHRLRIFRKEYHVKVHKRLNRPSKKPQDSKPINLSFQFIGDFENQLQQFVEYVEKNQNEEALQLLYRDLRLALINDMPSCQIIPFGSAVTGLSLQDSDVDCFVILDQEFQQHLHNIYRYQDRIHKNLIRITKNNLYKLKNVFTKIVPIYSANIPIVKFLHVPTNINCDVSFKGGYGVHNSKYLAFLLKSDIRIKKMLLFIKLWAKIHNFIGYGKFTSYALSMLVVFFFQQLNPPILLPIIKSQEKKIHDCFIDGWNCGFDESAVMNFKNTNSLPCMILMSDFFSFYSKFKFSKYIISTYTGKIYKTELFEKAESFPEEFSVFAHRFSAGITKPIKKHSHFACIQDPFEHSRNITSCLGAAKLKQFQLQCNLAYDTMKNVEGESFSNALFNTLLSQETILVKKNYNEIKVEIPITINLEDSPKESSIIRQIKTLFESILVEIFRSKYNLVEEGYKEGNNFADDPYCVWCIDYICMFYYNIWFNRKQYSVNYDNQQSQFVKEKSITDAIIVANCENKEPLLPMFKSEINVIIDKNAITIQFGEVEGDKKIFSNFRLFTFSIMRRLFREGLKKTK